MGTQALLDHYRNYRYISPYLKLSIVDESEDLDKSSLTQLMKTSLNQFLAKARKVSWMRLLEVDKVTVK